MGGIKVSPVCYVYCVLAFCLREVSSTRRDKAGKIGNVFQSIPPPFSTYGIHVQRGRAWIMMLNPSPGELKIILKIKGKILKEV